MQMQKPGHARGERHFKVNHGADVVEHARTLRDSGLTYQAIAQRVNASIWTVRDWCDYRTRL